MRPTRLTLFVILIGSLALAIAEGQDPKAQTMGPHVTTLFKTGVAGMEGKPWNVSTVDLVPGAVDARHVHPGVELVYVLEGTGSLEVDDQPPVPLEPGSLVALEPHHRHVLKNTSLTHTLKVLVVQLREEGQPGPMLANRGTRQQKEECERIPNGAPRQPKANEHNNSTITGLVF